jgi:hypothetical protein
MEIRVTLVTGGDDNRGGAVIYGTLWINGQAQPKVNLNGGQGLGGNSTFHMQFLTPPEVGFSDITGFTIEHDGAPRNFWETYDNWNLDRLLVQGFSPEKAATFVDTKGRTIRLTGEKTSEHFDVDPSQSGVFITLFEHARFQGQSFQLALGEYFFIGQAWNDIVSSIRVPEMLQVEAFQHADFQGFHPLYASDVPYVGNRYNDQFSSFVVSRVD